MDTKRGDEASSADLLAGLLATHPEVVARLLVEHSDDGSGRCAVCSSADSAGRSRFPCRLRSLAERAKELLQ